MIIDLLVQAQQVSYWAIPFALLLPCLLFRLEKKKDPYCTSTFGTCTQLTVKVKVRITLLPKWSDKRWRNNSLPRGIRSSPSLPWSWWKINKRSNEWLEVTALWSTFKRYICLMWFHLQSTLLAVDDRPGEPLAGINRQRVNLSNFTSNRRGGIHCLTHTCTHAQMSVSVHRSGLQHKCVWVDGSLTCAKWCQCLGVVSAHGSRYKHLAALGGFLATLPISHRRDNNMRQMGTHGDLPATQCSAAAALWPNHRRVRGCNSGVRTQVQTGIGRKSNTRVLDSKHDLHSVYGFFFYF